MAKIALLIGVSDYGSGLAALPGTQADLEAMQHVLRNPQVAGFDQIDRLPNPDPMQMQLAIEKLFLGRDRNDLILLYFSGHGVRDDNGMLYFATAATRKNSQGHIFTATAVPANFVQGCMSRSRSKRQVLILDCCFSGAFANDMKAKADEAIDINLQLGGEGRAVLTSSSATQVSYEKEGASIYTRYLVQGLETGAADRDSDGQITIDELHHYAKEKVQEAAPSMQPEIYAVREGYSILIARAPQGDRKLTYRKEFEERAKQKRGKLSAIDRRALKFRAQELELSEQEVEQINNEVLQPFEKFWTKLNEFEEALKETLKNDPQMNESSLEDLQYIQQTLKLRDGDIAPLLHSYSVNLTVSTPSPLRRSLKLRRSFRRNHLRRIELFRKLLYQDNLKSEKGLDYTQLQNLLKVGNWREADEETYRVMIQAVGRKEEDKFTPDDLFNFPCQDLHTINRLWAKYSLGKFGFSVQKQIYIECAANLHNRYSNEQVWETFGERVGWCKNKKWLFFYKEFQRSFKVDALKPKGHLPCGTRLGFYGDIGYLFSRVQTCGL